MKRFILPVMVCSPALGCSDVRPDAGETSIESPELTAEIARAALVEMLNGAQDDFSKSLHVERSLNDPLDSSHNGALYIGPCRVDLIANEYTVYRGPGPHAKGCHFTYRGKFQLEQNKWVVTLADVWTIGCDR